MEKSLQQIVRYQSQKHRRGRPRKDEVKEPKEVKRVERQLRQSPGKSLSQLDRNYGWGCKTNSQGKTQYTKGYKLHLDVTDQGIPVSARVTEANVHDSQVAIPLEKMTERRITLLKDHILPSALYVKGHRKVRFVLLLGVLCLAALKILQTGCPPTTAQIKNLQPSHSPRQKDTHVRIDSENLKS